MAAVSAILSACQGRYEWGTRDCLTTAQAVIGGLLGADAVPDVSEFHSVSMARATALMRRRYGGYFEAHMAVLSTVPGLEIMRTERSGVLRPGDMVWLEGEISAGGERFELDAYGGMMGFVDETCAVLVFCSHGLAPAEGAFSRVMVARCRSA